MRRGLAAGMQGGAGWRGMRSGGGGVGNMRGKEMADAINWEIEKETGAGLVWAGKEPNRSSGLHFVVSTTQRECCAGRWSSCGSGVRGARGLCLSGLFDAGSLQKPSPTPQTPETLNP